MTMRTQMGSVTPLIPWSGPCSGTNTGTCAPITKDNPETRCESVIPWNLLLRGLVLPTCRPLMGGCGSFSVWFLKIKKNGKSGFLRNPQEKMV